MDFKLVEDAVAARSQVQDVLNDDPSEPNSVSTAGTNQFFIGADFENDLIASLGSEYFFFWENCLTGCMLNDVDLGIAVKTPLTTATYATFTPTVIPLPAAVWLFGSGLLGLIGIARRKKTA